MNYLPFDLETALRHPERVVTGDGRKVEQLTFFKRKDERQHPIYAILDGDIEHWNANGKYCSVVPSHHDLFLLPEVKECWVNVYDDGTSFIRIGDGKYRSMDEAKFNISDSLGTYIKTIRITNEIE